MASAYFSMGKPTLSSSNILLTHVSLSKFFHIAFPSLFQLGLLANVLIKDHCRVNVVRLVVGLVVDLDEVCMGEGGRRDRH